MPVPKKRHSNVRQGKRRFSNYTLSSLTLGKCPHCGAEVLPHHICSVCGTYKGQTILKIKEKKEKKKKKLEEKSRPADRQAPPPQTGRMTGKPAEEKEIPKEEEAPEEKEKKEVKEKKEK